MLPTVGTYKTVASIDTAIAAINAPNFFWFTNPTLSGTETTSSDTIYNSIPWTSITYGNPANLDTTTGVWTCPATGLWQFTFSIFCENYSSYTAWVFFHNGTVVSEVQLPANGGQWLTSDGPFITPTKAGNTTV